MKFVTHTIHTIAAYLRRFRLDHTMAVLLLGFWLMASPVNANPINNNADAKVLGKQIHERLEQTDRGSDRPKTTGEFLDEARGDVPLNERLHNITRDSAESLKQLGQEYSSGVQENVRAAQENVQQGSKNLLNRG